jgi:hypothetical protein
MPAEAAAATTEAEQGEWLRLVEAWFRLIPSYARTLAEHAFLAELDPQWHNPITVPAASRATMVRDR